MCWGLELAPPPVRAPSGNPRKRAADAAPPEHDVSREAHRAKRAWRQAPAALVAALKHAGALPLPSGESLQAPESTPHAGAQLLPMRPLRPLALAIAREQGRGSAGAAGTSPHVEELSTGNGAQAEHDEVLPRGSTRGALNAKREEEAAHITWHLDGTRVEGSANSDACSPFLNSPDLAACSQLCVIPAGSSSPSLVLPFAGPAPTGRDPSSALLRRAIPRARHGGLDSGTLAFPRGRGGPSPGDQACEASASLGRGAQDAPSASFVQDGAISDDCISDCCSNSGTALPPGSSWKEAEVVQPKRGTGELCERQLLGEPGHMGSALQVGAVPGEDGVAGLSPTWESPAGACSSSPEINRGTTHPGQATWAQGKLCRDGLLHAELRAWGQDGGMCADAEEGGPDSPHPEEGGVLDREVAAILLNEYGDTWDWGCQEHAFLSGGCQGDSGADLEDEREVSCGESCSFA